MTDKTKEHRNVCRLVVAKIVDSGPITSNNTDIDEEQVPVIHHSPQQKRPFSPVPTGNIVNNKKIKLDQPINNIKKKQVQSVVKNENSNKIIVNKKKIKLISHKSSSVIGEKIPKNLLVKELNQTATINKNHSLDQPLSKPRTSIKLTKSQSTNDIKPFIKSPTINIKKKDSALVSPSKTKPVTNPQIVLKKVINKNPQKISIKTEKISTPTVQSPSNVITKQESPPAQPSSTTTTTSVPISNLKKIPKKSITSSVVEKRSRSSMASSSLNRNSIRDSQKQESLSSKTQSNLKRQRSSSSINNSNSNNNNSHRSGKTNIIKHQSSNLSQHVQSNQSLLLSNNKKRQTPTPPLPKSVQSSSRTPTPPKSTHSPLQSHIDLPINSTTSSLSPVDIFQPPVIDSPPSTIIQNEDNHVQSSMDIDRQNNDDHIQLSDESNSAQEEILIAPTKITSYSDQSDTNNTDNEDEEEEEDLPTSLTNDDLRYKLIYIYKRFQLNSLNDLTIFVRFFKRHQLIDISSLSMTKTSNEMFTYDLFSLSPSHIIELANDLGYTTTSIINSIEQ